MLGSAVYDDNDKPLQQLVGCLAAGVGFSVFLEDGGEEPSEVFLWQKCTGCRAEFVDGAAALGPMCFLLTSWCPP